MTRTLTITRDKGWADSLVLYDLYVDQRFYGPIEQGTEKSFQISENAQSVYLKLGWGYSNTLEIKEGSENLQLECGSNLRGLKVLLALVYATVLRKEYIWLKYAN